MHFVYQTHRQPKKKQKKGAMLDNVVIHVMDGERAVCGVCPSEVKLTRLSLGQVGAWLFSQREGTKSFSATLCWTCGNDMRMRLTYRGADGVPEGIINIFERLDTSPAGGW